MVVQVVRLPAAPIVTSPKDTKSLQIIDLQAFFYFRDLPFGAFKPILLVSQLGTKKVTHQKRCKPLNYNAWSGPASGLTAGIEDQLLLLSGARKGDWYIGKPKPINLSKRWL